MKPTNEGLISRVLRLEPGISLGQWAYDRISNNISIIVILFSGGGFAYLSSLSKWMEKWGPIGYATAALLCVLIIATCFLFYGHARRLISLSNYAQKKANEEEVNVLAPTQQDKRIDGMIFYHPYFQKNRNIRFENCEIMGPVYMHPESCQLTECHFIDCEIIIAREDRPVKSAVAFANCIFLRTKFYRTTFLMSLAEYNSWPDQLKRVVPVISDGRVGDI